MAIRGRIKKEFVLQLIRSILFWTVAMMFFAILRYAAIDEEVGVSIDQKYQSVYDIRQLIFTFSLGGFLMGIIYAIIEFFFDHFFSKKLSTGVSVILQVLIVTVLVISIFEGSVSLYTSSLGFEYALRQSQWYTDLTYWPLLIYIFIASFVFSIWVVITEKFNTRRLFNVLLGHYKNPKEEKRIFMFLDLKSSTTYAEKLGHFRYSQLIQDCFYDLNMIAPKFGAEIYQYVGDEAVIIWDWKEGIESNQCVELFFAFKKQITLRAKHYQAKYDLLPVFKAGIHGGAIMAAEVGFVKREVAYHGDIINTAARIQGECNKLNAQLLISDQLLTEMKLNHDLTALSIGKIALKGKKSEVAISQLTEK